MKITNKIQKEIIVKLIFCALFFLIYDCSNADEQTQNEEIVVDPTNDGNIDDEVDEPITYADINFSNWKLTLPVDENDNGKPDEYAPSQLVDFGYQTLEPILPFMYDDILDSSIVFYTYPEVSTTNSSYSRTELRELINPSNSKENWTLDDGGIMKGRLKMESVSEDNETSNNYHNVIVMQIHGIISQEDMDIQGFTSNNGPPLLKMYWKNGFLWAHKKSLVNENTNGDDLLDVSTNTWEDIKHNFGYVGFEPFDFEIKATAGKLELKLNDEEPYFFEDVSLSKWPFENYFKAGNYLTSTNANAFAYVKYYNLYITH